MKLRIAVDECLKRSRVSPASSGAKRIADRFQVVIGTT